MKTIKESITYSVPTCIICQGNVLKYLQMNPKVYGYYCERICKEMVSERKSYGEIKEFINSCILEGEAMQEIKNEARIKGYTPEEIEATIRFQILKGFQEYIIFSVGPILEETTEMEDYLDGKTEAIPCEWNNGRIV